MLSSSNIESLIAVKRREIEKEKALLGLSSRVAQHASDNKENANQDKTRKQVKFSDSRILSEHNDSTKDKKEKAYEQTHEEDFIPASLERYIRKYIGLPVMLKAGEYSPNNPLVRGERAPGDALLGLGEYERRRNTLRKIRQQQYREYLDHQAKKKQEAKEQAERERREREQRERDREERERELLQERDRFSADRRRSVTHDQSTCVTREQSSQNTPSSDNNAYHISKVDTGVQVNGFSQPLSVAVQTDDTEMFRASAPPSQSQLTQAERELSPRSVPALALDTRERRRSYGDFDERACLLKKCSRDRLSSDLRHTYMPSIFDAEAIRLRNMQAEKEAAERRQFYQQELKNQIEEQQRIREERKCREKMLEQAEMRRLEEQLRMLRVAQDREVGRQHQITANMKENASEYHHQRTELQREIDAERNKLMRVTSQPNKIIPKRNTNTSKSDTIPSKLPLYYSKIPKKPYSINIPDNSIFSSNYDVDSYLRRNLNFNKEKDKDLDQRIMSTEKLPTENKMRSTEKYMSTEKNIPTENIMSTANYQSTKNKISTEKYQSTENMPTEKTHKNVIVEKALIHEPKANRPEVITKQPSRELGDDIPIPVLRHSPRTQNVTTENTGMSEAMKKVEDKWKVPAVQKNILKALPNEEGRNVSILTQLGSIRRQLQLEQLKLDRMLSKDDV